MKTKKDLSKVVFSSLGSGFEYYDFAIYMVFATAIGSKFFDSSSQVSSTLMAFMVFAAGYLLRPFGAILFGYIGDKYGRVKVLKMTMLAIFASTLGLALLPGVETLGITATILFMIFRSIQSIAIGAEIPIAVTYSTESFKTRQGLMTGVIFACLSLGIVMTALIYFLLSEFTSKEFINDYGWRIGFLFGSIITFMIYQLRKSISESEEFIEHRGIDKESFFTVFRKIVIGVMIVAAVAMFVTQLYMFLPSYCSEFLGDSNVEVSKLMLFGSLAMLPACIIGGFVSDYVSKRKMMALLLILLMSIAPLFYQNIIEGREVTYIFITMSILLGFIAPTYNVIIKNAFLPAYRCRGLGISYNFGYLIFSTPMPIISILLIQKFSELYTPVYMIVIATMISLFALVLSKKFMKTA